MKISQLTAILVILLLVVVGAVYTFKEKREQAVPEPVSQTDGWNSYSDPSRGFMIRYPAGFSVNDAYLYSALGPGKEIDGVSFAIPASMATGTNLSDDTRLSVEMLPLGAKCEPASFLDGGALATSTVSENGLTYLVGKSTGAGAGNFYDETVYVIRPVSSAAACTAIRYYIHSGNIGNYPEGAVREFDREELVSLFDQIRATYQGVK